MLLVATCNIVLPVAQQYAAAKPCWTALTSSRLVPLAWFGRDLGQLLVNLAAATSVLAIGTFIIERCVLVRNNGARRATPLL